MLNSTRKPGSCNSWDHQCKAKNFSWTSDNYLMTLSRVIQRNSFFLHLHVYHQTKRSLSPYRDLVTHKLEYLLKTHKTLKTVVAQEESKRHCVTSTCPASRTEGILPGKVPKWLRKRLCHMLQKEANEHQELLSDSVVSTSSPNSDYWWTLSV